MDVYDSVFLSHLANYLDSGGFFHLADYLDICGFLHIDAHWCYLMHIGATFDADYSYFWCTLVLWCRLLLPFQKRKSSKAQKLKSYLYFRSTSHWSTKLSVLYKVAPFFYSYNLSEANDGPSFRFFARLLTIYLRLAVCQRFLSARWKNYAPSQYLRLISWFHFFFIFFQGFFLNLV